MIAVFGMRTVTSNIITFGDVKNYFKGKTWSVTYLSDKLIEVESKNFEIKMEAGEPIFKVKIFAIDDESDSSESNTKDPIKFITDFMRSGMSYGSHNFSTSKTLIHEIIHMSVMLETNPVSRLDSVRLMRKLLLVPILRQAKSVVSTAIKLAKREVIEKSEIEDIKKTVRKKGWRMQEVSMPNGSPKLIITIGDLYTVEIYMSDIEWKYSFSVKDMPDTMETGITKDPIKSLKAYYRKPGIEEISKKRAIEQADTSPVGSNERVVDTEKQMETVKPQKPAKPQTYDYESGL